MKLKRGQKLCKNCNGINGARSHVCKHCNTEFVKGAANTNNKKPKGFKTRIKKYEEIVDWKLLQRGDKIKVVGRSGNYYINPNGERQYLTDAGIYTIKDIDERGLHVYDGGYGYIYMGPEVPSEVIPNMYRSPHKILKANIPTHPRLKNAV